MRNRADADCVKPGMGTTSIDPQALRLAAQRLDDAADLLDVALRVHLVGLRSVDQLVAELADWRRDARDGADGLRAVAERFLAEDRAGAEVLR